MSQIVSPVSVRRFGLATVCRVWRMARSGVYRRLAPGPAAYLRAFELARQEPEQRYLKRRLDELPTLGLKPF
jgi:predicted RNA polymerase sigma factor